MTRLQWLQAFGALAMVSTLAAGRFRRLRPYGRRLTIVLFAVYLLAAVVFVVWRIIVGPAAPLE